MRVYSLVFQTLFPGEIPDHPCEKRMREDDYTVTEISSNSCKSIKKFYIKNVNEIARFIFFSGQVTAPSQLDSFPISLND